MKSCFTNSDAAAVQPDPSNWRVLKSLMIGSARRGGVYVMMVHYPNCTNFEGNKVMVLRKAPPKHGPLDPHFTEGGNVIARFEPTDEGFKLAEAFASLYVKDLKQ